MKSQRLITLIFIAATLIINACGSKSSGTGNDAASEETDIHTAVVSDNMEAVKKYIQDGKDLNVRDPFGGSSPLISAAVFGKRDIARVLLQSGADVNFQNNDGSTALHTAAFFCRPEIVQLLLDKNADKTVVNKYGATAYDNVAGPFEQMKDAYDMMETVLGPMGLELDYDYIQKTRPEIAAMLNP